MSTKTCPSCGRMAHEPNNDRHNLEHGGGHMAVHGFQHGHPLLGLLGLGIKAVSHFKSRTYQCGHCGHVFKA